jgi:hypothetical protein
MDPDALLTHAEALASALELDMEWKPPEPGYNGYWKASDGTKLIVISARANRAIAFLQNHTGEDSHWTQAARSILQSGGDDQSMETGARGVGEIVRQWIEEVRAGYATPRTADAVGARIVASTDLMDQVRKLVDDRSVHPAAPVVLAAAALEIALRSAVEELSLITPDQQTLNGYMLALKEVGVLNRQDVKDITQIAGVRNDAAHGLFDEISRERAGLLEQQVNLMLSQLPDKVAAAAPA